MGWVFRVIFRELFLASEVTSRDADFAASYFELMRTKHRTVTEGSPMHLMSSVLAAPARRLSELLWISSGHEPPYVHRDLIECGVAIARLQVDTMTVFLAEQLF